MTITKKFNPISKIILETNRVAEVDNANLEFLNKAENFINSLGIETSNDFKASEPTIL